MISLFGFLCNEEPVHKLYINQSPCLREQRDRHVVLEKHLSRCRSTVVCLKVDQQCLIFANFSQILGLVGPLSQILFNVAVDFIYQEICDTQFATSNGYKLVDEYDPVCLTGFADDNAFNSHSEETAIRTIELVQTLYLKICLHMNPDKSQLINVKAGKLIESNLRLSNCIEKNVWNRTRE